MRCAEWVQCFGLQRICDAEAHLSRYLFVQSLLALAPSYGYTMDKQQPIRYFCSNTISLASYMHTYAYDKFLPEPGQFFSQICNSDLHMNLE